MPSNDSDGPAASTTTTTVAQQTTTKRPMPPRRRRKKKAANSNTTNTATTTNTNNHHDDDNNNQSEEDGVEIEYIPASLFASDLDLSDPALAQFSKVLERFQFPEQGLAQGETKDEKGNAEDKDLFAEDDEDDEDAAAGGAGGADGAGDQKLSKKKLRKLSRYRVAELKRLVEKPEVVEWVDVTAVDPLMLVALKSTRNTVSIPRHWGQKRRYLQNKRGIEKPPFRLPEFIRATGIQEMREAVREKENAMGLKQKTRERVQPKMGKIEINYEKLHDAFFRWQTKPEMTQHGEMYYEGKEFETKMKERKPGNLSEELKTALNMPPGAPPPWLIAMQRYGPPPSYPNMRIPGLNAPIPPGGQWGFFPGGWGAPPIDEQGRPLYGDIFDEAVPEPPSEIVAPIQKGLWGELEEDEAEYEEEEEAEAEGAEEEEEPSMTGLETPSGVSSVLSSGLETPDAIQLRKDRRGEETPDILPPPLPGEPRQLYQVLPQKDAKLTGLMGSTHTYDISGGKKGAVDVALDPTEMENLDEQTIKAKYEQKLALEKEEVSGTTDFSDMVAEHAAQQSRKRKKTQEVKGSKKAKEFKF